MTTGDPEPTNYHWLLMVDFVNLRIFSRYILVDAQYNWLMENSLLCKRDLIDVKIGEMESNESFPYVELYFVYRI